MAEFNIEQHPHSPPQHGNGDEDGDFKVDKVFNDIYSGPLTAQS